MSGFVLDSSALTRLAERRPRAIGLIEALQASGSWPPVVPSVVLVESLHGNSGKDAGVHRFLKTCRVVTRVDLPLARRAAELRRRAGRGSAVDALVVASAEPGGVVLTSDLGDLGALAAHADGVQIERI